MSLSEVRNGVGNHAWNLSEETFSRYLEVRNIISVLDRVPFADDGANEPARELYPDRLHAVDMSRQNHHHSTIHPPLRRWRA